MGSGFGGAVAACRLAQAGVDVAILERGRRFELGSFPRPARAYLRSVARRHDVTSWQRGGAYDVRPLNDVFVVQAAGYGGGSLIYANVQMRPPPDVFDEGWPRGYTRARLDPYYDLVAHMLDVSRASQFERAMLLFRCHSADRQPDQRRGRIGPLGLGRSSTPRFASVTAWVGAAGRGAGGRGVLGIFMKPEEPPLLPPRYSIPHGPGRYEKSVWSGNRGAANPLRSMRSSLRRGGAEDNAG